MDEHSGVVSVHLADLGPMRSLRTVLSRPRPRSITGLRAADVALATPLQGAGLPRPSLSRVGLIAFWDDDASVDGFLASHPLADTFASGWRARLRPLRAHGTWPGLDDGVQRSRDVSADGPAVVLTLGRLRVSHVRRFLRASRPAEQAALAAPGFVWGTALARPPFVATCSLWDGAQAIANYAYGSPDAGHPRAMAEQRRKDFHKRSAFVRFRPYDVSGSLSGTNPLPEQVFA